MSGAAKLLPDFDGKPENLQSFLDAISLVDLIKGDHEGVAVNLVKTKLKGVARTLISDEATLEAVAERLKSAVKGETPKVLQAKLMAARQNSKSANSYIKEIEDLTKSLAAAYIGDGMSHSMAERYSTDSAVKALVKNASNERVKVIMESGNFTSMNEVVAKFVDSSTSSPSGGASINHLYSQPPRNNNRYRGRGHGQFRRNNRGYNSYRGQSRNFTTVTITVVVMVMEIFLIEAEVTGVTIITSIIEVTDLAVRVPQIAQESLQHRKTK